MGMSTHIIGLKSGDSEEFKKHEAVLRACLNAGIDELPKKTADYFGDNMVDLSLLDEVLEVNVNECYKEYNDECIEGYEIKVKDIPEGVDIIRVYNSY